MEEKRKYRRLNIADRMNIQAMIHNSFSITEIAKRLRVHKSTISREIKRNSYIKFGMEGKCRRTKDYYINFICQLNQ